MPKKRTSRIYWRERNGERRAYGDFRDYADVGGRQEALVPPGAKLATTDADEAAALASRRLTQLKEARAGMVHAVRRTPALAAYAQEHLRAKAREGAVTVDWLQRAQVMLERAVEFFGASRELGTITAKDCSRWTAWLRERVTSHVRDASGQPRSASNGTVRHHLNVLSDLYRRAIAEQLVPAGGNPVATMYVRPIGGQHETAFLEVHEAALLLAAARRYRSPRPGNSTPHLYEFLAALLLTGGRAKEIRFLRAEDVSFDRHVVRIRVHQDTAGGRLKTDGATRVLPLWPQLAEILGPFAFPPDHTPRAGLLFTGRARRGETAQPIGDVRKQLLAVAEQVGLVGRFGTFDKLRVLRTTYMAARLQTTEHGEPVAHLTIMREGGWASLDMIDRVYSRLGAVRHRTPHVEYRLAQHGAAIQRHAAQQTPAVRRYVLALLADETTAPAIEAGNVTAAP